jgi:pyridoxine 4-dehydrogenase
VTVTAATAGIWQSGDLTVNRLGFGAMRLTGRAVSGRGAPGDRDRSISVLRRSPPTGGGRPQVVKFLRN